jgi:hypothetical protein
MQPAKSSDCSIHNHQACWLSSTTGSSCSCFLDLVNLLLLLLQLLPKAQTRMLNAAVFAEQLLEAMLAAAAANAAADLTGHSRPQAGPAAGQCSTRPLLQEPTLLPLLQLVLQ